jgi:biopolymer transport protein ExbD
VFEKMNNPQKHTPWHWLILASCISWITVLVLLLMFYIAGNAVTSAEGVWFDLPETVGVAEIGDTKLVAMVVKNPGGTMVFFDDSRYTFGDSASMDSFLKHLKERTETDSQKTLLVLADRRVASGELMSLASFAEKSGIKRVFIGGKKTEGAVDE